MKIYVPVESQPAFFPEPDPLLEPELQEPEPVFSTSAAMPEVPRITGAPPNDRQALGVAKRSLDP